MKTSWAVSIVVVGAVAVAGAFVQGMTRVAGLGPTQAQAARPPADASSAPTAPSRRDGDTAVSVPSARIADSESPQAEAASRITEPDVPPPAVVSSSATPVDETPVEGSLPPSSSPQPLPSASSQPSSEPSSQPSTQPSSEPSSPPSAQPQPAVNVTPARPAAQRDPARPASTAPALTTARRRRAQCEALAGWLQQLETIAAERRNDAGYQEWTRAQRQQARDRQAEIGCARAGS